jgi:hypothetical protein
MSNVNKDSEYALLFNALLYNVPALAFTWGIIWMGGFLRSKLFEGYAMLPSLSSLSVLVDKFDSLRFIIVYIVVSVLSGFVVAYFVTSQQQATSVTYSVINWVRKRWGKSDISASPVWGELFDNRNEPIIEIIRANGESYKGFLRRFSDGDKTKELTIDNFEVVEKWHEYLTEIKSVYYHLDSDTLIKFYDTEDFCKTIKDCGASNA